MKVYELIEMLQECDSDAEVLMAHQPSWPLQFTLRGVATSEDIATGEEDYPGPIVYLVEGSHPDHPYAPHAAWDCVR